MNAKQQSLEKLLVHVKTCIEEERARIGFDPSPETLVPSWLPELEAAIEAYETEN